VWAWIRVSRGATPV